MIWRLRSRRKLRRFFRMFEKIRIILKVIRNKDNLIDELMYVIDLLEANLSYAGNISYAEVRRDV